MNQKKTREAYSIVLALFIQSWSVYAEYNPGKMGEVIGSSVTTIDLFNKLSKRCPEMFYKHTSIKVFTSELSKYVTNNDLKQIHTMLLIKPWDKKNQSLITNIFAMTKNKGLSYKASCGIAFEIIGKLHKVSESQWEYAKNNYSIKQ